MKEVILNTYFSDVNGFMRPMRIFTYSSLDRDPDSGDMCIINSSKYMLCADDVADIRAGIPQKEQRFLVPYANIALVKID